MADNKTIPPNAQTSKASRKPGRRARRDPTTQPNKSRWQAAEARRQAKLRAMMIANVQKMIDDPDPRHDGLRENYFRELWIGVDRAERRLSALVEKFALSQRAGFQLVKGGRRD